MVVAAGLSALATFFAAYATFMGPRAAARLSEELRRSHDKIAEARRNKLIVFANLMENRASLSSATAVGALNLIDVVYHDCLPVREAWAELFHAFDTNKNIPPHEMEARLRRLLLAMANDLGLSDNLKIDDIGRVYFPAAFAEENELAHLERRRALERLRNPEYAIANQAVSKSDKWPPAPA
jgi:hypothetical protein